MSKTRLMTLVAGSLMSVALWQAPAFAEEQPKEQPKQEEAKKADKAAQAKKGAKKEAGEAGPTDQEKPQK